MLPLFWYVSIVVGCVAAGNFPLSQVQIFEGDAPYILSAFCRPRKNDLVDENSCRYQNSDYASAAANLNLAIASNCCRRNPNRSIDWPQALLGVLLVRSRRAIASGRSSLKLHGFSPQQAGLGSEFDIG